MKHIAYLVLFYGASGVHKAGDIIESVYPRGTSLYVVDHFVSLLFCIEAKHPKVKKIINIANWVYCVFGSGSHHSFYNQFMNQATIFNNVRKLGILHVTDVIMDS